MHIPERSPDSPAHQTGAEVVSFDEEGKLNRWRVEESDALKGTVKLRDPQGRLISAKSSRTFTLEEAERIVASWNDIPDAPQPHDEPEAEEKEPLVSEKNALRVTVLLAIVAIAFLLMQPEPTPAPQPTETVPRSEASVLTEELNALNLRRAPLIESCEQLKEVESSIRLRTDRLSEIRNK